MIAASLERIQERVIVGTSRKQLESVFSNFFNFGLFVKVKGFQFLGTAYFSSHLVLHVLEGISVLQLLVLFDESQLLQRTDLVRDLVVLDGCDCSSHL